MKSHEPYKRRQYLVDRTYQLRFVTHIFMVVLAIAITSSLISTGLLWSNMYQPELETNIMLVSGLVAVAATLLIELLLAIPIVFYLGIRQSHRVVGPLNRLKRMMQAVSDGDFS